MIKLKKGKRFTRENSVPSLAPSLSPTRCCYLLAKLSIASIVDYFASDTSADVRAQSGLALRSLLSGTRIASSPPAPPPARVSALLARASRVCRRTHADSTRLCINAPYVYVHRPRSNRTRSYSQCRTTSGCESRSSSPFPPSPSPLSPRHRSPRVLFGTASSFIRQCAVAVSSRDRISRLFYACAFIANSKYRPIPISRSAFLTTTIFRLRQAAIRRS